MKKIYVLTVVCLAFALAGSAQTYTWTGATSNNWTTASNWSPGTDYPHLAGDNAVFNSGSPSVVLDVSIDLNTLTISGASVKITATTSPNTITLHSTSAGAPGLSIASGSMLENDAVSGSGLSTVFLDNGQASVNGTWKLSGDADVAPVDYILPSSGAATRVIISGKMIISPAGYINPNDDSDPDNYLVFGSGSILELQTTSTAFIPVANYDANSLILIDGLAGTAGVSIDDDNLGNLTYNCPSQGGAIQLGLGDADLKGNLTILNTNNFDLTLIGNGLSGPGVTTLNIGGNVSISGTSKVVESKLDNTTETRTMTVAGNFTNSASFNMQTNNSSSIKTTTLSIKGNFLQTGSGSFIVSSAAVNQSTSLFVVEFNGTSAQTISSSTGTIDNASAQVTLKINNPAGVTLNSPLATGRIDFSGATPGRLNTTTSNLLTIDNTSGNAIVVRSPSNTAYVNGAVARKSASTAPVLFPTGLSNVLRTLTVTPATSAANTFLVNLKPGTNAGPLGAPLAGLSNYSWDVTRSSGTSAATIVLSVPVAEPGRTATDTLLPAAFNGSIWQDARLTGSSAGYIFPGNGTGTLTTSPQSSFVSFAVGYSINSALAIKLTSFTGKKLQNAAQLSWDITDNSTPAKFEIVRSVDGINFSSIGTLAGAGGRLSYSFMDLAMVSGNNYYRLKMYDIDGTVSFSNIIVVMNGVRGVMIGSMIPTLVRDRASTLR